MPECLHCDGELDHRIAPVAGTYSGESFTVMTDALVCPKCGYTTVDAQHADEFLKHVADAYRSAHKLLTSTEIKALRLKDKRTQEEFAKYLGVGVASIKRWELGRVQDAAMDELIRLKTNYSYAENNYTRLLKQGGPCDEFSGWRHFSIRKFEQASLFFVKGILSATKKRLTKLHMPLVNNKLLWFADCFSVSESNQSITGLRYARIDHGPVPDDYRIFYRLLQDDQILRYPDAETLEVVGTFEEDAFTRDEMRVLNQTWDCFKNRLEKIEDLSHDEPACMNTSMYELISFASLKSKPPKAFSRNS